MGNIGLHFIHWYSTYNDAITCISNLNLGWAIWSLYLNKLLDQIFDQVVIVIIFIFLAKLQCCRQWDIGGLGFERWRFQYIPNPYLTRWYHCQLCSYLNKLLIQNPLSTVQWVCGFRHQNEPNEPCFIDQNNILHQKFVLVKIL